MPPSRRATLGLFGSATAALLAGCSAVGLGEPTDADDASDPANTTDPADAAGSTTRSTPADGTGSEPTAEADGASATFEMRLVGPDTDRTLFTGDDVARVGEAQRYQTSYGLPITLDDDATERVGDGVNAAGVVETPDEFEFVLRRDGEEMNRFSIARDLAADMAEGEWEGKFVLMTVDREAAEALREAIRDE